jgi:hypothetical protein
MNGEGGKRMRKRQFLGSGLVIAVVSLTAALIPTADAWAASTARARPQDTAGYFTLCSDGGYGSTVFFPDRGDWTTGIVPAGSCYTYDLGGSINEEVDVYMQTSPSGGVGIGSTIYNGAVGETIVTIAGPSFYVE